MIHYDFFGIIITMIINVAAIAFFTGELKANQQHQKEMTDLLREGFEEKFARLEAKQDKHNNLIERMVQVEASAKSAHKRIDSITREVS